MNHNEYRAAAAGTAIYPGAGERTTLGISYLTLGLVGEASEIAELIGATRYGAATVVDDIRHELGDVLWYDAMLTTELRLTVADAPAALPVTPLTATFGLITAAGQVAEIVKKAIRAGTDVPAEKVAAALVAVRAQVGHLAAAFGMTVEEIRQANVDKLAARFATNTIKVHA